MKNYFLAGSGPSWLGGLQCTGEERHLALCQFSEWNQTTCEYGHEDAGVTCDSDTKGKPGCFNSF